ncbi:MAG: pantoate--beta-alanine ligase [Planctomycetota bacterium]
MDVIRDIPRTRQAVSRARGAGRRIALIPTMGALHRAHVALMAAARQDQSYTVVSIFVNPTQFGPSEDYQEYPRDEAGDLRVCEQAGIDLVFIPPVEVMYPSNAATTVQVAYLTEYLCGAARPGHFAGVATVCAKLFNIVQPDRAYFGQKDAQQLAVIRQMTRDLDMPLEIVGCPTVREDDGLAVSSRNNYLSPPQRRQATCLYRALTTGRELLLSGTRESSAVEAGMRQVIKQAGPAEIDYASVVDPDTIQPVGKIDGPVLLALAVRIGPTRLIDNLLVDPTAGNA